MSPYSEQNPSRALIDTATGPLVLEFGSNTCGICSAAQSVITAALAEYAGFAHIKVQDGRGRPLGRSFGVKLWPTLIFMRDGREMARVVRPETAQQITAALTLIAV